MFDTIEDFCGRVAGPQLAQTVTRALDGLDIGGEPTRHPYGFYIWKIAIPESFGFSLRLHAWLPETRPRQKPDWPAHNHHADLHSLVLKGRVTNHEWDWQPGEEGDRILYGVGYDGHLSLLNKTTERGSLVRERVRGVGPLEDYRVPGLRFHASEVASGSAAVTLVLFSTRGSGASKVAGDPLGEARYVFDRLQVDPAAAARARRLVTGCLGHPAPHANEGLAHAPAPQPAP